MNRLLIIVLLTASCSPVRRVYIKGGDEAALRHDYDTALNQYKLALEKDPGNIEYRLKYEQSRFAAAFAHYERGHSALAEGDSILAKTELGRALEIDPSQRLAQQELQKLEELDAPNKSVTPVKRTEQGAQSNLEPKVTGPISVQMIQDGRAAFETLSGLRSEQRRVGKERRADG